MRAFKFANVVLLIALALVLIYSKTLLVPSNTSLPPAKAAAPQVPFMGASFSGTSLQDNTYMSDQPAFRLLYTDVFTATPTVFATPSFGNSTVSACSQIWNSFPGKGISLPQWLTTPVEPADLFTDEPYTYLAGQLIRNGIVSAAGCSDQGLLENGNASPCGLERARPQVTLWQNQLDPAIYQAAIQNAVPAFLIKSLFAQESQFWIGESPDQIHFGPGQTTQSGLDPLFIWFPSFYYESCPAVFGAETCAKTYTELTPEQQAMIRGYLLLQRLNLSCPSCVNKVDLSKSFSAVDTLAKVMIADCHQTNQLIFSQTQLTPGQVSSYEDLWRITLAIYNVGSGCVGDAIQLAQKSGQGITWDNVAKNLKGGACQTAIGYVENITK